ncbi:MAG: hypothetical protein AB2A00_24675 [Myxococcota bacterium]
MSTRTRQVLGWVAASITLLLMAVRYAWPLPQQLSTHVPGDQRDPLLNAALLDHVFRSVATFQWGKVWDTPIFHPHEDTLAFSESFLGTVWYGVPLWILTPDPIALHNAYMVAGLFFSALAATVLGRVVTGSLTAGMVAGVVYAFGPFHLVHSMHVQMHQAYGAPLGFLGLWWVVRGSSRRGWGWILAAAGMALQVLSCSYLGLFAMALAVPCVVVVFVVRGVTGIREDLRFMSGGLVVAGALLVIPLGHYHRVSQELGFQRNIQEIRGFAARADSHRQLPPNLMLPPSGMRQSHNPEDAAWPGRVAPALTVLGALVLLLELILRRRRGEKVVVDQAAVVWASLLLAGLSVWLSFGPGPGGPSAAYPYSLLYHYVPGFTGLRVPSRFYGLTLLMLAVGAAVTTARMTRLHARAAPVGLLMAAACALDVWPRSYPTFPLPDGGDMGPILRALKDSDSPGPILEVPYRLYWRSAQHDLNTVKHGRTTANGYSGVEPPLALALRYLLPSFPLSRTDELVRQLGVTEMILHRGEPRADRGESVPFLERALRERTLPAGFTVRMDQREGAWLQVEPQSPGPRQDLSSLWTEGVRACAGPAETRRMARVDMPISTVVVTPRVRHRVEVEGESMAWMRVPAVGMVETLVGAVPLGANASKVRLKGSERWVEVQAASPSSPGAVRMEANLPPQMTSAQGLWLRVQVFVDGGVLNAAPETGGGGHEVKLVLQGIPGSEVRPTSLPLRTDAAPGCPGVAEGVVEFLRGVGAGQLRLVLVKSGGGVVSELVLPLELLGG